MTTKASGRSAFILTIGLFVFFVVLFTVPSQAAASTNGAVVVSKSKKSVGPPVLLSKGIRHGAHRWRRFAHGTSSKAGRKSRTGNRSATNADPASMHPLVAIPPAVANANAQLTPADNPIGATAIPARQGNVAHTTPDNAAGDPTASEIQIASVDQPNDVDRAPHESEAATAPAVASGNEASSWDQATLIGKIFIGFGALLTLVSAARMFMT